MNNLKPYTKYKPTNIAWLGDIPEHWEVRKLKYLADNLNRRRIPIEASIRGNMTIRRYDYYGATGVIDKVENYIFDETTLLIAEDGANLVMRNLKLVYKATGKYWVNNHAHIISPKPITDIDYLAYYLEVFDYNPLISGSAQPKLTKDAFQNIEILFPPKGEQQTIANFLDYKLSKIDRFIQKKKQLIKLLNEQKAGIINDAVTKGLNPNTKMKPSGVEWLGDIPEHWEVIKLIGVCDLVRGNSSFKKDELLSSGKYVALQYGKTYKVNEVDENYQFYVNDEFYKVSQIVNYGDVIFISTSETVKDLGHSVFYNRNDLGLLGGEQILLRPKINLVSGKYLCYSSKMFAKELKKYATGVKVYRFNISDLKTVYTSVPPFKEQQQIVSYIEQETAQINAIIQTIEKEITLTQEYRVALIAEAVTGKIDVRAYEIPETPIVDLYEELEDEMSLAAEDEVGYSTEN